MTKPFDKEEFRQASFLGEFVRPLVAKKNRYIHFWSTYYTTKAKLRIYGHRYKKIEEELFPLRDRLGLKSLDEEKSMTLVGDLGHKRFIGAKSVSTPEKRALKILASLQAVTELAIDSIYRRPDGYWDFEENDDKSQNPIGNHLFSVTHLYHNITAADGAVVLFDDALGKTHCLSHYYYSNAVGNGCFTPMNPRGVPIKL